MANLYNRPRPLLFVVMDGVGVAPQSPGNAVSLAHTPVLDKLWPAFPHTYLQASGLNVGLPHGVDGNSEVGHMNLGAGKVVFQELPRIDNSINTRGFFKNSVLIDAMNKQNNGTIHIMGIVGTGQVHGSFGHLMALLDLAVEQRVKSERVAIHVFTDGRDSAPKAAKELLERLDLEIKRRGVGRIASIIGRYYSMDRDNRWEKTKKAYELIAYGLGKKVGNWRDAIAESYANNKTDQYIEPYAVLDYNGQVTTVKPGDSIVFFNYRPDRAVQLTRAFEDKQFPGWNRKVIEDVYFVGMSKYEKGFPLRQAFPPELISMPLGKVISENGLRQLRIAESEKFAHVTYFINGRDQRAYPGEDRVEVPSPRDVATFDKKPEMSSKQVTDVMLQKLATGVYDFAMVNYANADMVAHTGNLEATIEAMQTIDECIGRLATFVLQNKGCMLITADHGNAEELINLQDGSIDTKHSTNPVPLLVVQAGLGSRELSFGNLSDVAPTILGLLGIQKPVEMTGRNLIT